MKFKHIFIPAMVLLISGGCDAWRNTTADPGRYGLSVVSIESRVAPLFRGTSENTIGTIRIYVRGKVSQGIERGAPQFCKNKLCQ